MSETIWSATISALTEATVADLRASAQHKQGMSVSNLNKNAGDFLCSQKFPEPDGRVIASWHHRFQGPSSCCYPLVRSLEFCLNRVATRHCWPSFRLSNRAHEAKRFHRIVMFIWPVLDCRPLRIKDAVDSCAIDGRRGR